MLRALLDADVMPDVVVGNSIGAMNGAALAADPSVRGLEVLESVWNRVDETGVFTGSLLSGTKNLVRTRTAVHSNEPLRRLLERMLPGETFEDLKIPFQCVAASIERAAEHWFFEGPLVKPILASCAVPGILPPVAIDGEHYLDGGLVNSIPVARAVELGATEIYVLHVGRIERPLTVPRNPWQVGMVAFEIARRHRFARDISALPDGVVAHVLPTGERDPIRYDSIKQLRYRDFKSVARRIETARVATAEYLAGLTTGDRRAGGARG